MNKLKQQFSELRRNTPKHVQWLLLAVAFIVVLILLTLLLTGRKHNKADVSDAESDPVILNVSAADLNWADTPVGAKRDATINITASAPARVLVRLPKEIAGLNARSTCNNGEISPTIPCTILLEYTPSAAANNEEYSIAIDYRGASEPEALNVTEKITLNLGAIAPAAPAVTAKPEPTPVTEPAPTPSPATPTVAQPVYEPDPTPVYESDPEPVYQPAATTKEEIQREIETIAPSDPFAGYAAFEAPQPAATAPAQPEPEPEKCSDFAFAGYNNSGTQIGWIKPERGAYYFHPFSDTDCNNPTGKYNPDTGIITDIKNASKRIGTDAEHIGRAIISADGAIPQLGATPRARNTYANDDYDDYPTGSMARMGADGWEDIIQSTVRRAPDTGVKYETTGEVVVSTQPYDRSFILRQYKPIPATIVSDVRADVVLGQNQGMINFPVRATVDRNVYADNGRTIIIPTGTLLLGYVTGEVPGPYKSIGRMQIRWYQFVLPNGVEFNFNGNDTDPFSGDSQGRVGVPGRGSTDYLEQFVMPMLTAIVPAAVNMIAPMADRFVNQIDLDNNTVVQSGTVRSSELAKNEIITAWNQVAQKLMVDMMDNTVPPFTIPAGTRITVYSPVDLQVACTNNEKCNVAVNQANTQRVSWGRINNLASPANDDSWVGQVRSFNWSQYCEDGKIKDGMESKIYQDGLDYRNVLFYCQTNQYQAINNARQDAIFQSQQQAFQNTYAGTTNTGQGMWGNGNKNAGGVNGGGLTGIQGSAAYNENVLGLVADENGYLSLPKEEAPAAQEENVLTCLDGGLPDVNGCCAGEEFTYMEEYEDSFCCPVSGGDCFPPLK